MTAFNFTSKVSLGDRFTIFNIIVILAAAAAAAAAVVVVVVVYHNLIQVLK